MFTRQSELVVPARLDQLGTLCEQVVGTIRRLAYAELDARTLYDIELAVSELATNIITHAYADTAGDIAVVVTVSRRRVVVETQDTGAPFQLEAVPLPDLDEGQLHGYGVFLMRALLDDVAYDHTEGVNRWRLEKRVR